MRIIKTFCLKYIYKRIDNDTRKLLDMDVNRYLTWDIKGKQSDAFDKLMYCMNRAPFRNVFYYRIRNDRNISKTTKKIMSKIYPQLETIEIDGKIGGGLMISHNFSVIYPETAGENLRIAPGVVIGRNGDGFPKIGNNVWVAANASVIGNVTIGNNVIVAAGAVVVHDVPNDCVVGGNPAKVIRYLTEDDKLRKEIMFPVDDN